MDTLAPPPGRRAETPPPPALDHVESWIFDLDNTLYPASCNLFLQVDHLMKSYIVELLGCDRDEAHRVQKSLFHSYGTTMRGLMTEHGVDPKHFLDYVHAVDHSPIPPNPALDDALARLPGHKYVFTNASVGHAERVLERLGIARHFGGIFDIIAAEYLPKPNLACYERMLAAHGIEPRRSAMFDDIPKNLEPAAALGMTTIWIRTDSEYARIGDIGDHIHYVADDIAAWLDAFASSKSTT